VAQGYAAPANPPPAPLPPVAPGAGDAREIEDPAAAPAANKLLTPLPDFSNMGAPNWSFDPNTAGALALQRASFLSAGTVANTGHARQGLGVVLPISVPTNYTANTRSYWESSATPTNPAPVPCTNGKYAPSIICPTCTNVLCPDGGQTTCLLPVDTAIIGSA